MDGGIGDIALPAEVAPRSRADAYRALVGGHLDMAYRRAAVLLGDQFEAEDAVHDAALRAWRHWAGLRDESRFEAWFGRILINVCRDRLRRRRRLETIEAGALEGAGHGIAVDDETWEAAGRDRLRRLLAVLAPDDRVAIVLRYEADLTVPAIAALMSTPEGTVKSRLHRALAQLRASIEVDGHE
jgi:RNA polymerase sigma-70 factor, ECF subfamily